MVQKYIKGMSNRGPVITWSIANAATKALIRKYPNVVGDIDLDSWYWAQSLFHRMGFSRCWKTSTKVDLSESARKEIEYLFLYEIISKVEKKECHPWFNFDQTPLHRKITKWLQLLVLMWIMDIFTGKMTSAVKDVLEENHILVTNVSANLTRFYQRLDLMVNGSTKRFIAKKFNSWSVRATNTWWVGVSLVNHWKRSISNCTFWPWNHCMQPG